MTALIEGKTGKWEYIIGLEIHAQILSNSKLFSGSSTKFGATQNSQVSLLDAAMPGMLPVLNEYCVRQAVKTGIALNAQINQYSIFDRKNYFYPDLPQGYQISQFYHPIVGHGYLMITLEDGNTKKIVINHLHLEQDAGKSLHDQLPVDSLIDLNRCGVALMEIVTEPDLRSPYEAGEYVKKLRNILRAIGSCDGDMEKGSLRCDANVSVRKIGNNLGTRCEIKNLNSIRYVMKAIEFEAKRQVDILENGGQVVQETRLFNVNTGETRAMRNKEDANDYRYFPDPDLLPIKLSQEFIDEVANSLPELPDAKIARYISDFDISRYDAEVIVGYEGAATYFEQAAMNVSAKMVANWIISELFALLNRHNIKIHKCKVKPAMLQQMVKLIESEVISGKIAKTVFEEMFNTGHNPEQIIRDKGLGIISDDNFILSVINEVLVANKQSVIDYNNGKEKLFGFFVGQVMQKSRGKANPSIVNKLLKEKLSQYTHDA